MAPHAAEEQLVAPLKCVNRIYMFGSSKPSGSNDRLPKEHTKTRNHNNANDKTPRVEN